MPQLYSAKRSLRRAVGLLVVLFVLRPGAPDANAASSPAWIKVTAPEFTVITTLSEKRATTWAAEFSQFVAAMRVYFPGERRNLPRLTFVVFDRERDFNPYRPTDSKGKPEEVAGFFLRQDSWAVAGMAGATMSEDVRHVIFHEGTHWFLSSAGKTWPVWFEEGLAEVFSTFHTLNGRAEWGRSILSHIDLLEREGQLPLEKLLFTPREKLFENGIDQTGRVYAQSWVFVHFLLFGDKQFPRAKLQEYLNKRGETKETDQGFRETFGLTYAQMDFLLKDYTGGKGGFHIGTSKIAAITAPTVGPASAVEVADALARLAFAGGHEDKTAMHANQAIAAAPTDPRGHEILGVLMDETGKTAEAQAAFADAERYGSKDFKVYYELALHDQVSLARASAQKVLSASEARGVADRYRKASELNPTYRLTYANFATMVDSIDPLKDEDRKMLAEGVRRFPEDEWIAVGSALVARKDGDNATARTRLNAVLAKGAGSTSDGMAFARQVDAAWVQSDGAQPDARNPGAPKNP